MHGIQQSFNKMYYRKKDEMTAHVITKGAIRRLIKTVGGRRFRQAMDLYEEVPGTTDSNGVVHEIFTNYLDDLVEKTVSLMQMQRSRTMLPRHVREIATILGDEDPDETKLPYVSFAAINRHIRLTSGAPPGTRFSNQAMKLLLMVTITKTLAHLRLLLVSSPTGASGQSGPGTYSTLAEFVKIFQPPFDL